MVPSWEQGPWGTYGAHSLQNRKRDFRPAGHAAHLSVEVVASRSGKALKNWRGDTAKCPSSRLQWVTRNSCSQVQEGGPAAEAGLEDGDIVIEVNGLNVLEEPYEKVVDRIQGSGKSVTLLVCGKKAYAYFQANKVPVVSSMADPLAADSTEEPGAASEHDPPVAKERVSDAKVPFCPLQPLTGHLVSVPTVSLCWKTW